MYNNIVMDNMKFLELKKKYNKFFYNDYEIVDKGEKLDIYYYFSIEGLSDFKTIWSIDKKKEININDKKLNILVFSLGLVEMLSIWKLTCSENICIKCGNLDETQIKWWKKLLLNGMGEFFYVNNIDFNENMVNIVCKNERKNVFVDIEKNIENDKTLIPIGGGKDSAVTIELLKDVSDRYCYIINKRKATIDTFSMSGIDSEKLILANRKFDEKIIKYNNEGFLNGHTPFSSLVSFSSVIASYINDIKYVALSNESSANESTVKESTINHQYSKTYEYEKDFYEYEKEYINSGVWYFSLLRPITEVGIAKIFSRYEKYHKIFRSCNVGSKKDEWCGSCAKCFFVYIILSSFVEKNKMVEIFGKNLFNDEKLIPIFDKLIGKEKEKPFECVGSRDEVNASLKYIIEKYEKNAEKMPVLLDYYKKLNIKCDNDLLSLCKKYDENNNVPDRFVKCIKEVLKI